MAKLILVRHGQTDWDKENRIKGSVDLPLNNDGKEEAQKISNELSKLKIKVVYSSCSSCSFSTATEIAEKHKVKVKKMKELNEFNHGIWQGLLTENVKKRYKKQYSIWRTSPTQGKPPKGETLRDAYERAVCAMHKIVDKHKGENICFVSGDIVLSLMKCHLKNVDLENIWKFVPQKTWWEVIEI